MKKTICILLSLVFALAGFAALCVSANAAYNVGDVIEYGNIGSGFYIGKNDRTLPFAKTIRAAALVE